MKIHHEIMLNLVSCFLNTYLTFQKVHGKKLIFYICSSKVPCSKKLNIPRHLQ